MTTTPVRAPFAGIPNRFREGLLARRTQIGLWCSLASPSVTDLLGTVGFDWLLLDGEHAPNDVVSFIPQLMALKDSFSAPVVRPPWNDAVTIKRLLDAGFYNFLIPFVESADEARKAVESTRYPPAGIRGVSATQRHNRYGTVPDYFARVNDNIAVMVQIESRPGLAAVDAIAAVDGVDGVFIGPQDLAAALGHLGNASHPEVQHAIRHLFDRTAAHGKASGILTTSEVDAQRYIEWGAKFVAVGTDIAVFRSGAGALREMFKST